MNEAIVAKLGLDVKNFRDGLSNVANYTERAHGQMARGAQANAEAHESLFKSENKVEGKLIGLSRNLTTATDGYEATSAAAEALTEILHLPLAVGASIGIAIVAYEKLAAAIEQVEKANEGASDSLAATNFSGAAGESGSRAGLANLDTAQAKLEASRTYTAAIADTYLQLIGRNSVLNEGLEKSAQLEERRLEINAELANITREEAAARQIAAGRSAEEGERALAKLATEEKIAQLRMDPTLGADSKHELIKAAEAEGEETQKTIEKKYQAQRRENELARALLDIQNEGNQVEIRSAQAKAKAADEALFAARTKEEVEQATLAVAQAYSALTAAQTKAAHETAMTKFDEQSARLKGDPDSTQFTQFMLKRQELQRQLADEKDDQTKQSLRNEIEANESAFTNFQEQLRGKNAARATGDAKALEDLEDQNAQIEAQFHGMDDVAESLAIQADYAAKIKAANQDGNTDLAAALVKQKDIKLEILAQNTALQNRPSQNKPLSASDEQAQRRQAREDQREHDRLQRASDARQRDREDTQRRKNLDPGADGHTDLQKELKPHLDEKMKQLHPLGLDPQNATAAGAAIAALGAPGVLNAILTELKGSGFNQ